MLTIYNMPVESVNIKQVKARREAAQEAQKKEQKIEDRRDMKMRIKAMKRPMNKVQGQQCETFDIHQCSEYKAAPALMLVEAVSKGAPIFLPADGDRLKQRLLRSQDIDYLLNKVFMNYTIESDSLKLLLTLGVHTGNEVLTTLTERKQQIEELPASKSSKMPTQSPPLPQSELRFDPPEKIPVQLTK